MTYLLDVNVLIALVDSAHLNHDAAHRWFSSGRDWSTCPLTQNAFVRILSNHAYPTVSATPDEVVRYLKQLMSHPRHTEVSADISIVDQERFVPELIGSSGNVTDVYLLGLAHHHGLRLATFDRRIRHSAVVGASPSSIELIPA